MNKTMKATIATNPPKSKQPVKSGKQSHVAKTAENKARRAKRRDRRQQEMARLRELKGITIIGRKAEGFYPESWRYMEKVSDCKGASRSELYKKLRALGVSARYIR